VRRTPTLARLFISALAIWAIDFLTKSWALENFSSAPRRILGDFLQFTLLRNPGAAFSMATGFTIVFTSLALVVMGFILFYAPRITSRGWALVAGLVLGGVLGNLTDRIFREPGFLYGHVIDWIEIPNFPVFNIADIAISSAAVIAGILTLRNVRPIEIEKSTDNE
jgi:signal peptidase II